MRKGGLALLLLLVSTMAFGKKTSYEYGTGTGKVYIFGVSRQLTDSVVYVTNISEVDSIDLEKKTHFLPYRSEFSLQLKVYMEGTLRLTRQTTCVFYSTNRKKLSKKLYKIKKRYLDDPNTKIKMLDETQFTFRHPMSSFVYDTEQ